MNNYGKKLRSTIVDPDEMEILLLKQVMYSAVMSGNCCSYGGRFSVYTWADGFVIYKTDDPNANVLFKKNQLGTAIDSFLSQFIHEENFDLDNILFQQSIDGAGINWTTFSNCVRVCDLTNHVILGLRLQATIAELLDQIYCDQKTADEKSEGGHSVTSD